MGKVFLVGAGPGAADLLTVRAANLLARADIVFYDALVQPDVIALAVSAEKVAVGKRYGAHSTAQMFINRRLVEAARRHAVVVRLKGGDPMLFGRAQEELDALDEAGVEWEVVPGITTALAASAEAGVSLTRRGLARSVTLATPRVGPGFDASHWARAVAAGDTAVLYMAAGQADEIRAHLLAAGVPGGTPVCVMENVSLPSARRRYATLDALPDAARKATSGPAIVLLGEVYRERLLAGQGAGARQAAAD